MGEEERKQLRADGMIALVEELRREKKYFMTAKEIDGAIEEGRM